MMSEVRSIKKGWSTVAFGEVVRLVRERSEDPERDGLDRYVGLEHLDPDELRIRRWGDVADGTTFTNKFYPGQVLFGKRRAYQRKLAVADFSGVCSGDIYVFETKSPNAFLPELLPLLCQSDAFVAHAIATSAGSLSPRTNWKSLSEYEFALPPMAEQRRIVAVAQAAEDARRKLLRVLDSLEDVTAAQLEFPETSERVQLAQLTKVVTKGTTPTTIDRDYVDQGIPFLRGEDVSNGRVDLSTCEKHIDRQTHEELARSKIQPGDVLITIAGTIGRVGLVAGVNAEANCNQAVAIVRPKDITISPFLMVWLLTRDAQSQMRDGKVTGTISNLSLTRIKEMLVPSVDRRLADVTVASFNALASARVSILKRRDELRALRLALLNAASRRRGDGP